MVAIMSQIFISAVLNFTADEMINAKARTSVLYVSSTECDGAQLYPRTIKEGNAAGRDQQGPSRMRCTEPICVNRRQ